MRRWRNHAEILRRYGDDRGAILLETVAGQLEEAIRDEKDQLLSLSQAAEESGYSKRRFLGFEVALVELPHGTDLETVVEIFERINRTGESLSVFELLTARLWKHEVNLRELWEVTRATYPEIDEVAGDKSERYPKFTLQVIALLRGQECKRRDLILLKGEQFEEDWNTASRYVAQAIRRIRSTGSGGYGVVPAIAPPYSTMATPLAAIPQSGDRACRRPSRSAESPPLVLELGLQ